MKRSAAEYMTEDLKRRKADEDSLGLIISVTLRNFMCHENLHFELDPHLNFITGRNGSGKSAVLTGIILGLGGKSSTTGRFGNIRGFVKSGKNKAVITIQLRNMGDSAYKPEEYGDKIIVEREISKEGSSSYKLKSSGGRIVSNQKEELKNILIYMDIQIDNPVTMLTQENSRTFLTSKCGKSDKLYSFFYKGTGLEDLHANYLSILNKEKDCAMELRNKYEALKENERDIQCMRKNLGGVKRLDELKMELSWAAFAESEKKLEEKKKECERLEMEINNINEEMNKYQDHHDRLTSKLADARQSKTDSSGVAENLRTLLEGKKAERETAKGKRMKLDGALDSLKREQAKQKTDIQELKNSIKENLLKKQNDTEEQQKRDDEKKKLEELITKDISSIETLEKLRNTSFEKQITCQSDLENIELEIKQLEEQLKRLAMREKQVEMALRNKLNLFGDKTTDVLAEISRRKREFIEEPKGPIGQFITSKDSRWNLAIEACLSQNLLRSYCCDNHQDAALLRKILARHYPRNAPGILTSKYLQRVHDVRQHKARTNHPTVLDMLKINDVVIANSLIDQVGIENIILMEDRNAAVNEMLYRPPAQCKSGYLMNCDQICLNPYRMYSNTRPAHRSLLEAVQQNEVNELISRRSEINERLVHLNKERNKIKNQRDQIPVQLKVADQKITGYQRNIRETKEKIRQLEELDQPKDVLCLEQDLSVLKNDFVVTEKKINSVQSVLSEATEQYKNLAKQSSDLENSLKEEQEKFFTHSNELVSCTRKLEVLATAKAKYDSGLNAFQRDLNAQEEVVRKEVKIVEQLKKKAIKTCPERIQTERSSETIKVQISKWEKEISKLSQCDFKDLEENYNKKVLKLKESKRDWEIIHSHNKEVNKMLKHRERHYSSLREFTQQCIKSNFSTHLEHNHFEGSLDFFDEKKTLTINAMPRKVDGVNQRTTQLSGGERSFVTISFILALWNWIHMPFRILDEYDVFMDSNNRQLSIDLLVDTAKAHKSIQYIFLSPLELPDISKHGIDYKVHQMKPPERQGLTN